MGKFDFDPSLIADLFKKSDKFWATDSEFLVTSLGDWLKLVQGMQLFCVPAKKVGEVSIEDLMKAMDEDVPSLASELMRVFSDQEEHPHDMIRWDCCSGYGLKYEMGKYGYSGRKARGTLAIDDPRLFDILMTWPRKTLPIWQRPWVTVAQSHMLGEEGREWPLELRVYVQDKKVIGVSNYYPQIEKLSLGQEELMTNFAQVVADNTSLIADDLDVPGFTADWVLVEGTDGYIPMFLEGGPPYAGMGGAHPCCFEGIEIDGVALTKGKRHCDLGLRPSR